MAAEFDRYGMTYEQQEAKRKKSKRLWIGALCVLVLLLTWVPFALESATALEKGILEGLPAGMSSFQKKQVVNALAVWEQELPGLRFARDDLRFLSAEYGSPYAGLSQETNVTWLLFAMNDKSTYSTKHRAGGHTLRVGIVEDGSGIVLQKRATQEVFLDRQIDNGGRDIFISIH